MAGIYERVTGEGGDKVAVHTLGAGLREWARGNVTKSELVTAFGLDQTAQNEIDDIATKYNALSNDFERASFVVLMEDALILAEAGFYSKTKVKSVLGF